MQNREKKVLKSAQNREKRSGKELKPE
jgi:hypothetical protein